MRLQPGPHQPGPSDYTAPKKTVLVLSCIDARLLDDLVRFLDHDNLTNRYYHITFAGTALCLTDEHKNVFPNGPVGTPPTFDHWRTAFVDQVRATVGLSKGTISDVYIVQHADCGAFAAYFDADYDGHEKPDPSTGLFVNAPEEDDHRRIAGALAHDVYTRFCDDFNPVTARDKKGKPTEYLQKKRPRVQTFFMDLRGGVRLMESYPKVGKPGAC